MAGAGSRFKEAGYTMPKYEISAHGKTLFEWAMSSLTDFFQYTEQIIFIVLQQNNSSSFIREKMKQYELIPSSLEILETDKITDGQATSVFLAKDKWKKENGLLIYNIDTYVEPGMMTFRQIHGDGFIPCFNGAGKHWSFVKLDTCGKAIEVKEKERISDNCTVGAYYFKNCALYEQLYLDYYVNNVQEKHLKEKYVAPLYNKLIKQNGSIFISTIPNDKIHALGTPAELNDFISAYSPSDVSEEKQMKIDYNATTPSWHDCILHSPAPRHRRRIICKIISKLEFTACLDVGCAQPFLLLDMNNAIKTPPVGMQLFGCDISQPVIDENSEKYKNIKFFQSDISEKMKIDTSYDLVVCSEVIEHIKNDGLAIKNLCLLSANYLLLSVPIGKYFKSDEKIGHFRHYSLEQLDEELNKNGFEIVLCKKWGFPFHNLYKYAINYALTQNTYKKYSSSKYGFTEKLVSNILYILFFINDLFSSGHNLFVLAKKKKHN